MPNADADASATCRHVGRPVDRSMPRVVPVMGAWCERASRSPSCSPPCDATAASQAAAPSPGTVLRRRRQGRSEEHTSELQSLAYLVCRLLLEKKKRTMFHSITKGTPTRRSQASQTVPVIHKMSHPSSSFTVSYMDSA